MYTLIHVPEEMTTVLLKNNKAAKKFHKIY